MLRGSPKRFVVSLQRQGSYEEEGRCVNTMKVSSLSNRSLKPECCSQMCSQANAVDTSLVVSTQAAETCGLLSRPCQCPVYISFCVDMIGFSTISKHNPACTNNSFVQEPRRAPCAMLKTEAAPGQMNTANCTKYVQSAMLLYPLFPVYMPSMTA